MPHLCLSDHMLTFGYRASQSTMPSESSCCLADFTPFPSHWRNLGFHLYSLFLESSIHFKSCNCLAYKTPCLCFLCLRWTTILFIFLVAIVVLFSSSQSHSLSLTTIELWYIKVKKKSSTKNPKFVPASAGFSLSGWPRTLGKQLLSCGLLPPPHYSLLFLP